MGQRTENHTSASTPPRRRPPPAPVGRLAGVLAVAALVVAGGCSDFGGSDEAQTVDDGGVATSTGAEHDGDSGALDGDTSDGATGAEAPAGDTALVDTASVQGATAAEGRDQVFTATLELEVEVLEDSVIEASSAIEALGGFAANEDIDLGERRTAMVTYRVPADRFDAAIGALAAVGELQTQQSEAQDVTSQYADLEGRVTTLRTSISRLQGFLAEATDANQIASLEGELTRRESELESTEAQRRALADRIDLSTITVSFTGSESAAPVDDSRTLPTFLGGLETGWDVFVGVGAFVLSAVGFVAPFLPLVVVLVLLARWVRRRRAEEPATS